MPKTILVTGSSGLIGSEAVEHFDRQGHRVIGVDNNMRRVFFGPAGDTLWNLGRLKATTKRFTHMAFDIRDRPAIEELFRMHRFDLIVHCAAQPSHDKARDIPLLDFEVNLGGGRENSISMLEAIERIEQMTGRKLDWRYAEEARRGDHICYISNLGKFQSHYPKWKITRGLDAILEEMVASERGAHAAVHSR